MEGLPVGGGQLGTPYAPDLEESLVVALAAVVRDHVGGKAYPPQLLELSRNLASLVRAVVLINVVNVTRDEHPREWRLWKHDGRGWRVGRGGSSSFFLLFDTVQVSERRGSPPGLLDDVVQVVGVGV